MLRVIFLNQYAKNNLFNLLSSFSFENVWKRLNNFFNHDYLYPENYPATKIHFYSSSYYHKCSILLCVTLLHKHCSNHLNGANNRKSDSIIGPCQV